MENIKEKLQSLSIITRHPNRDWHKISGALILLAAVSLVWNIYFYFSVRQSVKNSETKAITSLNSDLGKESEISKMLKIYDDKKAVHESLKASSADRLEDPATS